MKKFLTLLSFLVYFVSIVFSLNFEYNIYYGNLHSHTSFSDGRSLPENAYEHAKKYGDFLAVTDHCYYLKALYDGQNKMVWTQRASRGATEDGKFVGLFGFEWTAGIGHINVFETLDLITRDEKGDLKDFYEWIVKYKKLAQFNHPGQTFGNFADFYFNPEADRYINLVEVGNGSSASYKSITDEMFENFRLALNRGWHLGPTANQDNHREHWLSANDSRTGILAKNLTYEDIMAALWSRRVFGSDDKNVKVHFYVNDTIMGNVLPYFKKAHIKLLYSDSKDLLDTAVIYSQEGIVDRIENINKDEFVYEKEFPVADGYEYFFALLIQKDGDRIVAAPVWLEADSKVKVNYVRLAPPNPSENDEVSILFDLYNYYETFEDYKLSVKLNSVEIYSESGKLNPYQVFYSKTVNLGKLNEGNYKVEFYVNGVNVQSKTFSVSKKAELSILIDSAHENDCLDRLYDLANKLKEKGINVQFSKGLLSELSQYDIIIVPTPSVDGLDFAKELYSEEIESLNSFGGKLYIIKGSDEEFYRIYKENLQNAIEVTLEELIILLNVDESISKPVKLKDVVYIDIGHNNDYPKDKYSKLENWLKTMGYEVQFIDYLRSLDGKYLLIANGKDYTDDEKTEISKFVENGGTLIISSKSDYKDGGHTKELNDILKVLNSPILFNDDQVIDKVNNYDGTPYKVLANGVRFYSACSLIVEDIKYILISSPTAEREDTDKKADAIDFKPIVLAGNFEFGNGKVIVLGKAIYSDYDFDKNLFFIEILFK